MIASINNISVSVDRMSHTVSSRIDELNRDFSNKLSSVESAADSVRSAVNSIDVTPEVTVNVDNHIS